MSENKEVQEIGSVQKFFNGYNKFRKFATGNSLDDLTDGKKFSIIDSIKDKLIYYIIGFILYLFINWKLTVAMILTIVFAIYFEKFIKTAKSAANEAENEILEGKNKR